jgi:hypothetical protein
MEEPSLPITFVVHLSFFLVVLDNFNMSSRETVIEFVGKL